MKKRYRGGCHCGAVRYEAALDLSQGTFKCNCSICAKARLWLTVVPPQDFRLLAGKDMLTEYRFGSRRIHHLFCRVCGVRSFGWGESEDAQGRFYAVHVGCLDEVKPEDLVNVPVTYVDGRHDRWDGAPEEIRHL